MANISEYENKLWPAERLNKFKKMARSEIVEVLRYEFTDGSRGKSVFLHSITEKQVYTFHDWSTFGRIYRCRTRSCPARLTLLPSNELVRLRRNEMHNHDVFCTKQITNFKAVGAMRRKAADLRTIASGRRIKKIKDIFTEVMIEYVHFHTFWLICITRTTPLYASYSRECVCTCTTFAESHIHLSLTQMECACDIH